MEAEHLDGFAQPQQPVIGQRSGTVAAQRGVDHVQVGAQLVGRPVRRQRCGRRRPGDPAEDAVRGAGQPARDAVQRPPVGLVGTEGGVVPRGLRQGVERRRGGDQPVGHRQLVAQRHELVEVVGQRRLGLPGGGPPQRIGGDEGVAVAVATDPGAGQQHRPAQQAGVRPALVERTPQFGVDGGDDLEQRQVVVAQRLVDLVLQAQPGQPQQRRLPEREHRAPQLRRPPVVVELASGRTVALPDELGDVPLDLRDRLAPDLGRVRGDHRADQGAGQLTGHDVGRQVGRVDQRHGRGQTAGLRR